MPISNPTQVDWTRPGAIGSVIPNTAAFTSLTTSGTLNTGDRIACPEVACGVYRGSVGAGVNIAASNTEFRTGRGTGIGAVGDLLFTTSDQAASGSTQHALTTKLRVKGRGAVLIGTPTDNNSDLLQVNGSASFAGAVKLASFTVGTVPSASSNTSGLIYISNEVGGATPAFSDGTNWRRIHDRAVIS